MLKFVEEKIEASNQSLFYNLKINHLTACIEGLTSAQNELIEYKKFPEADLND
jgi:hypothetical protein